MKPEKFELVITADQVTSTDARFTMNDLYLGDNYKPLEAYFKRANGETVYRNRIKYEKKISNQTMPRIACQVFEDQIKNLTVQEKETFPTCRYTLESDTYCGIFPSYDAYYAYRKTIEFMTYSCSDGQQFVIYCWNIFSTIVFVQECLKRFGDPGDCFVLIYQEKEEKEKKAEAEQKNALAAEAMAEQLDNFSNPYSQALVTSKNIILRGAPGTGKSYLAKEIAADIISNGTLKKYDALSDEQKEQVEFVQFHPSYDYSDFVEGLRPKVNYDGTMGFELQDGIFKRFAERARKNFENAQKSEEVLEKETSVQDAITDFFGGIALGEEKLQTVNGSEFIIMDVDDRYIHIAIPGNTITNTLRLSLDELKKLLETDEKIEKVKDVMRFFGKTYGTQAHSYNYALYKAILSNKKKSKKAKVTQEALKKYIFIIDEINRGEISKIFGELFFAIDPGYRGKDGKVATQYANMHPDPNEKFFVPQNVYIIGTMNDIDRSVDTFDFAMRRRFRFIEIKPEDTLEMLEDLGNESLQEEAIKRMTALNREILKTPELNENYQIGAAYFRKLQTLSFDQLWTDHLQPLLQDYVQGIYGDKNIMRRFANAYGYKEREDDDGDEAAQD